MTQIRYNPSSHFCCGGRLVAKELKERGYQCCDNTLFEPGKKTGVLTGQHCCGSGVGQKLLPKEQGCCKNRGGAKGYDPRNEFCCAGRVYHSNIHECVKPYNEKEFAKRIFGGDRAPGTSPGEDRWMTLEEFVENEEKRKKLYDYEELDQVLRPDWRSFYNFWWIKLRKKMEHFDVNINSIFTFWFIKI